MAPLPAVPPPRLDRNELAGAVGDLGTLLPLSILLITVNRLNPTVVFGLAGATYLLAGLYYRVPMAVQPLKSFSALAIGLGLGAPLIGSGALVMGAALLLLGATGLAGWLTRIIPKSLVRGIQLGVGLVLIRAGSRMTVGLMGEPWVAPALAAGTALIVLVFLRSRRWPAGLLAVAFGGAAGLWLNGLPAPALGPLRPEFLVLSWHDLGAAALLLALPQLPLTLTNSVAATRDVAETYYGEEARRVTPRALAVGLGLVNVAAGFVHGMPLCHGSGGMTAHYRFGARTGGASIFLGAALLAAAVGLGPMVADLCRLMPAPVLGVLMVYVGASHGFLIRDTRGLADWLVVLVTGVVGGVTNHNGFGMAAGVGVLLLAWIARRARP